MANQKRNDIEAILLSDLMAAKRKYEEGSGSRTDYTSALKRFNALIIYNIVPDLTTDACVPAKQLSCAG